MAKGKFFVFSTLAADVVYRSFAASGGDVPVADQGVLIKGGAGVADKRLETPAGVMTSVDADQLALLEADPVFQMHKKNGYITITDSPSDPEAVASDMESRDASAQLQDGDYEAPADGKELPKPSVSTDDDKPGKGRRA